MTEWKILTRPGNPLECNHNPDRSPTSKRNWYVCIQYTLLTLHIMYRFIHWLYVIMICTWKSKSQLSKECQNPRIDGPSYPLAINFLSDCSLPSNNRTTVSDKRSFVRINEHQWLGSATWCLGLPEMTKNISPYLIPCAEENLSTGEVGFAIIVSGVYGLKCQFCQTKNPPWQHP